MFRFGNRWTIGLIAVGLVGGVAYNLPMWSTSNDGNEGVQDAVEESAANTGNESSQGFTLGSESFSSSDNGSGAYSGSDGQAAMYVSEFEKEFGGEGGGSFDVVDPSVPQEVQLGMAPFEDGDRLLLGGNSTGAYQVYLKLAQRATKAIEPSLLLRLGLASELAGFAKEAEEHYREASAHSRAGSELQVQSLIGAARVWQLLERNEESNNLLSELALQFGKDNVAPDIRLSIYHSLSECLQLDYLRSLQDSAKSTIEEQRGAEKADSLEYFWMQPQIEPILASTNRSVFLQPKDATRTLEVDTSSRRTYLTLVQRPSDLAQQILLDVEKAGVSISQLIEDIGRSANLTFDVSQLARARITGRSIRIGCEAISLSLLLDHVLEPRGLGWYQDGKAIKIGRLDEFSPEGKGNYALDRVQRCLRFIQINAENGVERVVSFMHSGNLFLHKSDLQQAENSFTSAREMEPAGELAAMLYFDEASLKLELGDDQRALDLFYSALDQTLAPRLQALSYARIAELELKLGRPSKAIPASARGLRLSSSPRQASGNLLVLAKSYLLENDPFSANRVLFENAETLEDKSDERLGSLMATLARFRIVKPMNGLQNEGERLVLALAAIQKGDPKDFIDHLIVSRAFADVGFRTQARQHLTFAFEQAKDGFWRNRIQLELAQLLWKSGDYKNCEEVLQKIVKSNDPTLELELMLLRAKLLLELELIDESMSTCEELLKLPVEREQKVVALNVLGRAYQKKGQNYAAALCFAGFLPSEGEQANATAPDNTNVGTK